ncbi:TPA: GIY-YIG nuclease family protein [Serratia marcescens]
MTNFSGYVYILKNDSFQKNIFKIGFTKNHPSKRALQIYNGATGVPEPFDVVFACEVIDYKRAEKIIHHNLKAYRISNRREFFCIPLDVGKDIILEICNNINIEHGMSIDNPVYIPDMLDSSELQSERPYYWINIEDVYTQSMFFSTLTDDQERRISIVYRILGHIFSDSLSEWMDDFRKDRVPEREIKIWEAIAKAFSKVDSRFSLSTDSAIEVYSLLLTRSGAKKSDVMKKYKAKFFSPKNVSEILDCYELRPMPIVVDRIRKLSDKMNLNFPRD